MDRQIVPIIIETERIIRKRSSVFLIVLKKNSLFFYVQKDTLDGENMFRTSRNANRLRVLKIVTRAQVTALPTVRSLEYISGLSGKHIPADPGFNRSFFCDEERRRRFDWNHAFFYLSCLTVEIRTIDLFAVIAIQIIIVNV